MMSKTLFYLKQLFFIEYLLVFGALIDQIKQSSIGISFLVVSIVYIVIEILITVLKNVAITHNDYRNISSIMFSIYTTIFLIKTNGSELSSSFMTINYILMIIVIITLLLASFFLIKNERKKI